MKNYIRFVAIIMANMFVVGMQAARSDRPDQIYLSAQETHNFPGIASNIVPRDKFMYAFLGTGPYKNSSVDQSTIQGLITPISNAVQIALALAVDIQELKNGGLMPTKFGESFFGTNAVYTKNQIMDLFVSGAWRDDQDEDSIKNALLDYFVVPGNNPIAKRLAIDGFTQEIINEQSKHNILRPDEIELTDTGVDDLGLPVPAWKEIMARKDFIALFVTGKAQNMTIDSNWLQVATTLSKKQSDALLEDINTARAFGIINPRKYMDIKRLDEANVIATELVTLAQS